MFQVVVLLAQVFFCASGFAVPLTEVKFYPKMRVGVYIGTFDPPSFGHDRVARETLQNESLDLVVMIPNDIHLHKPFATSTSLRTQMLEAAYRDNSQIAYPDLGKEWFPNSRNVVKYLKTKAPESFLVSIVGSDVLDSFVERLSLKFSSDSIDQWALSLRTADAGKNIPDQIQGKPVKPFECITGVSSTKIREYFKEHKNIDLTDLPSEKVLPIFPEVTKFIVQKKLYR